ncbi:DNA-3-methyladenine glycosylase family protein [Sneathiella sp.]|jgi:DNA-3-methyladenine glycosylase II|uniref:DNA-3-methyladenine glycosylase family protein n=1 Tax=Sneathiella sp. TaxID=1964365 RepID=UPI0039E4320E
MPNNLLLFPEEHHLISGLDHIARQDPDFALALQQITPIPPRTKPAGFETLVRIIVEQQVSLASAAAIWKRLKAAIDPFTPAVALTFDETALRALGLSKQKAVYTRALAEEIVGGQLILEKLHTLSDAKAMEMLMQVNGIGRWTAEVYLIACLQRQDIWPAGDVALKIAMHHLKTLPERPSVKEMDELAAPLRPYRTLAARILWRYYADVVKKKP